MRPAPPTRLRRAAHAAGLPPIALTEGGRARALARARDGLAHLWVDVLGRSGTDLARALALRPVSIYRAARRGRTQHATREALVKQMG